MAFGSKIPVIGVKDVASFERTVLINALHRGAFSVIPCENYLFITSGEIERVRAIVNATCFCTGFTVKLLEVEADLFRQAQLEDEIRRSGDNLPFITNWELKAEK